MDDFKIITKPCVGCGFCCIKTKCAAGLRLFGSSDICKALNWSEEENRYFCKLMQIPGKMGTSYREELYVGAGCCCGLNSWRQDIKNRTVIKEENKNLDPLFQKFLHCLGREFISGDIMYLALSTLEDELIKDGMEKAEIENICKLIVHNFKNSRSRFNEAFMG